MLPLVRRWSVAAAECVPHHHERNEDTKVATMEEHGIPDCLDKAEERLPAFSTYLSQIADTTYGMTVDDYVRSLVMIGFEPLAQDVMGRETFHIFGREEGALVLTFDTFHRQRNCASVQFRTMRPIWLEPRSDTVENITPIDRSTLHVRLDARHRLIETLSFFEETTGFSPKWGGRDADPDLLDLSLEQDAAVALREGVSPKDIPARMRDVSRRRVELLPAAWRERLDIDRLRSSAEARKADCG